MRLSLFLILISILVIGCKEPEPRGPVQKKSGTFFKESVERSKKLLEQEQTRIKTIIESDSTREYYSDANGFWYYYEIKKDSTLPTPNEDDEGILTYTLMNLQGDTIYTKEEVGNIPFKVGKSRLFPGLRNALKNLREGEKASFLFPSSQAFGYRGDNEKIGPSMPIKVSVTLQELNTEIN